MGRGTYSLTPRQRRFALEYLSNNYNGTKAAIAAGYSARTAEVAASRLLRNVQIERFVQSHIQNTEHKLELKAERIDLEISRLCYRDPKDLIDPETKKCRPLDEIPEDLRRCIAGITVGKEGEITYRLERKGEALALACRRRGLLKDQIDVTVRTHSDLMLEAAKRAMAKKESSGDTEDSE